MFTEVELKYQVSDFRAARDNLLKIGADRLCKATDEKNIVYDMSDGSLKATGRLLRLREFGEDVILTVKEPGPKGPMKIRQEHETLLSLSLSAADELLKALGYIQVFHYEKTREIWVLNENVHICLDTLYFGKFVEIEAGSMDEVSETCKVLGFVPTRGLVQSYRQLQLMSSTAE